MVSLASAEDVEDLLGRSLTSDENTRIEGILTKLSELFRKEARQEFTEGQSTVRLKVNGGEVYLPQRPVRSVVEVTTDRGAEVDYHRRGQYLFVPLGSSSMVWVKYEHGGAVPDLVRTTVADAARQVLMINEGAASGVAQVTQAGGPYSANVSYATWAQGGSARLSPEDRAIARSFRTRHGNVWVG